MRLAHLQIGTLLLATAFFASTYPAAAKPQEVSAQVRVYDSTHKDYHNWDDNENKAWIQYQSDHHMKQHDFKKASKKEQADYWNWRHEHPNSSDNRR
ncbi:MAG TPA: hypothetical protein VIY69_16665 [Candidatus Acidoferrales bacterium]